jgi:hypothetical protein
MRGTSTGCTARWRCSTTRPTERWLAVAGRLSDRDDLHGLLAGRLDRLLLDARRSTRRESARGWRWC